MAKKWCCCSCGRAAEGHSTERCHIECEIVCARVMSSELAKVIESEEKRFTVEVVQALVTVPASTLAVSRRGGSAD